MNPRPVKLVKSSLIRKGFVHIEDGDHQAFQLYANGMKRGIRTFYSHGAKECDNYILGRMAKQVELKRSELDKLIDCSMSKEAYFKVLKSKGYLIDLEDDYENEDGEGD